MVGNVELGKMNEWVEFYEGVFGMNEMIHFTDEAISTEYSALMSKVMADGKGKVKFPINEPAEGKRKSQIEEYLEYYGGPGVQHVALITADIVATVRDLRERGVRVHQRRRGPTTRNCRGGSARSTRTSTTWRSSASWSIAMTTAICCRSSPQTISDRPTVFFEIIERNGARGFGEGNFKALFEAIEREQATRGNL